MACTAGTAAAQTDSLEVDTTLTLGEITVKGMRVIKKVDRQLIIPTKEMVKASSNGFELLNLMTLDGIRVDPVMQTVSSMEGGSVQVRINDIVASTQDIMALRPDEVVRVEYIDNPGIRYSDSGLKAVINYVVKRRSAGYVGGASTMQAFATGFNNSSAYFKYNYKKSEFSINYGFSYRGYDERSISNNSTYYLPDGTQKSVNYIGYNSDFMYTMNNLQLGYSLADPGKYVLDVRLFYNNYNSPNRDMRQLVQETGQPDRYLYNKVVNKDRTPSLDIYYSVNLPHNQNIMANLVGTYIGTDYKYLMSNYLFDESPEQSVKSEPLSDYSYIADGRKYSLIGEAMYTKTMKKTAFTAGARYSVSRTENDYSGTNETDAHLNSDNLYMFAQLQGNLSVINYQAGIGASYTSIHQGETGFNKWTARPQLSLSTSAIKNVFIRYSGSMGQNMPSLSQLTEVKQYMNEAVAYDGNRNLTPYNSYNNSLMVSWSMPFFDFRLTGSWYYAPDIIMTSYIPELQDDGTYLLISKPENQKSFSQQSITAYFTLHAIKDILNISLYGDYSNYNSRGLDYSHNYRSWRWGGYANLMLGRWNVSASFYTAPKSYFAESMSTGENQSNFSVSYKYKDLKVGLGVLLLGYAQGFDYVGKTDSKYLQSTTHTYIKDNGNMIYLTLSYNFSHGRKYQTERKKLNNSDNDNGIR